MAALTWILAKSLSTPAVTASLAAIGVTSGLLLVWMTYRDVTRKNMTFTRMQHRVVGEVGTLRDESECRRMAQRIYTADSDTAQTLFG